ncbi:MAG: knotted carbamoyltransferase YgeW [bacterium]|nr:knotted carbamoyltransferase YgeW [bacterium]
MPIRAERFLYFRPASGRRAYAQKLTGVYSIVADANLEKVGQIISKLQDNPTSLYNDSFFITWRYPEKYLHAVLLAAEGLQRLYRAGKSLKVFDTGLGISIFRDKSTRTRYSFRSACNMLGLMTEELDESTSQIAHGETVRETASMISFLTEVIGIRDDMYIGEGHTYQKEVSDSVDESFKDGILAQRPAVVNLQCDLDHPTQCLADFRYMCDYFGGIDNLRGKKIAMSWAYSPSYGKPLSVPQGVIGLMSRFGMEVSLAYPEGYDLLDEPVKAAEKYSKETGGKFEIVHDMKEAFKNADIVYPKSWAPFKVMQERTELLRAGKHAELKDLEQRCLAQNATHKDWECTEEMMKLTNGGKALYCHCLPADITGVSCKEGEVANSVFDRYRVDLYNEAGNKPFVIAAMILLTRFPDPAATLKAIMDRNMDRRLVK